MAKSKIPTSQGGIDTKETDAGEKQWHVLTTEETLQLVGSNPEGLSAEEAAKRLAQHGPNLISRGKGDTVWDLIWRQINNPLIWVLIVAAFLALVADPVDGVKHGLVIMAVVIINTIIGFIQEYKAGKAIEALSRMVPENISLLRDGKKVTLPATDLVPGDVVLLASGDRVPADMRLIQSRTLQIEEAALTGESVPSSKDCAPVAAEAGIGDRACMTFAGTLVTYGTGIGVVVATADDTELGRISTMLKETIDLETPLTKDLHKIGKIITVAIVSVSVAILLVGTWRTINETGADLFTALRETVIFAIALAVGAIPEGLPAIVTIALAIGVQRMAARNAVVRKLPAVETLGSTTVICSDKTGTLTRNEMTVQELWTPASGPVSVTGVGYEPIGHVVRNGDKFVDLSSDFRELLMVGAVCNDASLENAEGVWKINGDPTEGALIVSAEKAGMCVEALRKEYDRLDAIPFESENQFMATLNAHDGGVLLIKGAPEAILSRCTVALGADLDKEAFVKEVESLAARGMRVLAFASKSAPGMTSVEMSDTDSGFTFLGIQGMIDPPRPEAMEAIKLCHQAGIEVKMITGDHKGTAQAIADQIDILPKNPDAPKVITGVQLAEMTEEELVEAAVSCNVFARVAPEHKLQLVNGLQSRNHIVAMTGDGVNDAPALKQSNIGVAMGITGTAVSKEASEIVLVDDNFASISAAVEEGRRVYDNLIKSLAFVLPTNIGQGLILIYAVLFFPFSDVTRVVDGVAVTARELLLPLGPTQLLWVNLVVAVALALPLAFEAKEPGIMKRPPRDPDAPVLSSLIVIRLFIVGVLMTASGVAMFSYVYGASTAPHLEALAAAQTAAVTAVIMIQVFYLLNCRSLNDSIMDIGVFSNKTVFIGIGTILVLQAAFIYAPFMNSIFGTAPLELGQILMAAAVGTIILPVISFEKWLRKRRSA